MRFIIFGEQDTLAGQKREPPTSSALASATNVGCVVKGPLTGQFLVDHTATAVFLPVLVSACGLSNRPFWKGKPSCRLQPPRQLPFILDLGTN